MNLDDFVQSGGASIWQLGPRGTGASHLWDLSNVFSMGQYFGAFCDELWAGFGWVLAAMFAAEVARLFFTDEIKTEWKMAVFKLLFASAIFASYPAVTWIPAQVADEVMQQIANDAACNEALFTFMNTAEQGMLATFNPTAGAGVTMENQTAPNFLQGISYTLFFLVWWFLPIAILGLLVSLYVAGPYCLAFFVFKPMAGVAGMWIKLLGGLFLAYVLLCIAFHLLLASQVFAGVASTNAVADPYTTIAFSVTGILVAFSMPGFAVRLLGGRLHFLPRRPV